MKKRDVLNLIKYHAENNDAAFRNEAYGIAKDFDAAGDAQLADYILALLSDANTFVPQSTDTVDSAYLQKVDVIQQALPLPEVIAQDIQGVINAVGHHVGINKFLFEGPPGTGKTESVKQIATLLKRELYVVDFASVIDSRLGQTSKNITSLFAEMNSFTQPDQTMVLFDEIDALALDRVNNHDVREMGRATSTLLKELDAMSDRVLLFATTNLFKELDPALVRRFDAVIDFGRYTREDLLEVASSIMDAYASQFTFIGRNARLFSKIMSLAPQVPYPGELNNIIRSAIAFSKPGDEYDYLRRLYVAVVPDGGSQIHDIHRLREQSFTMREIEVLTGVSRSVIARAVNERGSEPARVGGRR